MKLRYFACIIILLFIIGCARQENNINRANGVVEMKITSPAFSYNASIPSKYTCDSQSQPNPPLVFEAVPKGAKSLALVMDDPDVPKALKPDGMFDHWVIFNIPPDLKGIEEGKSIGIVGLNGAGKNAYVGPCPPPQYEPSTHRYFFKLYALDTILNIPKSSGKKALETAMEGHIVAEAQLMGTYKRK